MCGEETTCLEDEVSRGFHVMKVTEVELAHIKIQ